MNQKTNDQIILAKKISERCAESGGELSIPEYFEIYSSSEILKDYDLTYDDIAYGIVGDGGDGGIDSIYTFLNGELIKEDTTINSNQKKNHIELIIIQSKTSASFKEDAVIKFRESAEDLLNLANDPDDYADRYNSGLIDKTKLFRDAYSKLASTFPRLEIHYYYATQGNEVHPNVAGKVPKLREDVGKMFGGAEFSFDFVGASKLLEMTRNIPSNSRILTVSESPIGTDAGSYICLVSLSKYFDFISDSGALARSIFESNVRDYQGSVIVNTGIRKTLENIHSENFWYLNNGVTIITPKAVLAGKQLTIEDPQIVNGLQTSHEIYQHFAELENTEGDGRAVLVRVICEEDEEARDRIIRATNSQTSIPPASLRSSDEIHRNIEDFLKANDFYYDRKKNHYKNQGMPVAKIISIPYMAQAMMATTLLKPDSARARPSTLINSDTEYRKIFSLDYPIDIYLKVIQIMKAVEIYLKPEQCGLDLERKMVTNIKYYVAMMVSISLAGGKENISSKLSSLPAISISPELLAESLNVVLAAFNDLGATDQVAKGSGLVENLLS
ncbi:AIPR family protein [Marinobacter sp. DY40_1A1]|uniref:AIPR family protein n=1 Tax=Marinobacter sp. DY40_1A1 TaxID=2583229 RepID=UPI0019033D34|nr:AIPR family protein [Marinobacter sp. DY40_1A1]MBK1887636.1 AIPR family protein [Marinobacter sp. DY40_1A1]